MYNAIAPVAPFRAIVTNRRSADEHLFLLRLSFFPLFHFRAACRDDWSLEHPSRRSRKTIKLIVLIQLILFRHIGKSAFGKRFKRRTSQEFARDKLAGVRKAKRL